jgi:hypothetical protein
VVVLVIIVLNVVAPVEDTAKDTKDSFYEEAEPICNTFHMYNMKILFGDFNKDVGRKIYSKVF